MNNDNKRQEKDNKKTRNHQGFVEFVLRALWGCQLLFGFGGSFDVATCCHSPLFNFNADMWQQSEFLNTFRSDTVLIYLPNCAVAMRKKSELRQHREHGRKQPKSIKIHQNPPNGIQSVPFCFSVCHSFQKCRNPKRAKKKNKLWRAQEFRHFSISTPKFQV